MYNVQLKNAIPTPYIEESHLFLLTFNNFFHAAYNLGVSLDNIRLLKCELFCHGNM